MVGNMVKENGNGKNLEEISDFVNFNKFRNYK
jgi:hypothetical protein